jgi:hypothetical protein
MSETLRERAERIYRFEVMEWPMAVELAKPEARENPPRLTQDEWLTMTSHMAQALRVVVFDLAEQIDILLGGQIKPK